MFVLPETPWTMYLNRQMRDKYPLCEDIHQEFRQRVEAYNAFLTVGAMAEEPQPPGMYPASHKYNSAFVYAPGVPEPARYDKIHLVPFGEFVPFRYTKGLFWLYRWLNDSDFNKWGRGGIEYSLTPGKAYTTFTMHPRGRKQPQYRFGVTICYEDGNPHLFRRFVTDADGSKRVDFMLNISNDGWFGHGPQQPQHLVNCAFRAVENRVAIARAVNTGISGFIRPDGVWYDVTGQPAAATASAVPGSQRHPAAGGITTRTATLLLDGRVTFYSRHGDVLALVCGAMSLLVLADAVARRARRRRAAAAAGRKKTS
jgi:apolipoprotein N-acyltransferase